MLQLIMFDISMTWNESVSFWQVCNQYMRLLHRWYPCVCLFRCQHVKWSQTTN